MFRKYLSGDLGRFFLRLVLLAAIGFAIDYSFKLFRVRPHPFEVEIERHHSLLKRKLLFRESLDVVIVGSSATESAVNPRVLENPSDLKIWNAGIAGKGNIWWQSDIIEKIAARNHPSHIVYAIETFCFGLGPMVEERSFPLPFLNSFKYREGFKTWVSELASSGHLPPLPAHQTNVMLSRDRTINADTVVPVLDKATGWIDTRDMTANPAWMFPPSAEFSHTPEEEARLMEMIRHLKTRDIRLSMVILPSFLNYHEHELRPKQVAATDALHVFLKQLVQQAGHGEVIDARSWLPEIIDDHTFWYDSVHLNAKGSALFSPILFEKLGYR